MYSFATFPSPSYPFAMSGYDVVHHGAKNSSTTAEPRASACRKVDPLNNSSSNCGAVLGAAGADCAITDASSAASTSAGIFIPRHLNVRTMWDAEFPPDPH